MSRYHYGIDVSQRQGEIDWEAVRLAGKEFAFVSVGSCGDDGKIAENFRLDSCFHKNMKGAVLAGIKTGVYLVCNAETPKAAEAAAREVLELVKPYRVEYPIALNFESILYLDKSKEENSEIAAAFLDVIEHAGYYGMLYTYKMFTDNIFDMEKLQDYDLMIAQVAGKCTFQGDYGIWQYLGVSGRCKGVDAPCNLSVAYKDYGAIISAAGLNNAMLIPNSKLAQMEGAARIRDLENAIKRVKKYSDNI